VEIRPAGHLAQRAARPVADAQMRDAFGPLVNGGGIFKCVPTLVGISALGSRFAVYAYDTASRKLTPPPAISIPKDPRIALDDADTARWAHDFLDAIAGEARLLDVVRSTRAMCDAL
ncbi:hypothetical protein C8J57DRAFT_1072718, partial [Mycena rebaudengoi]